MQNSKGDAFLAFLLGILRDPLWCFCFCYCVVESNCRVLGSSRGKCVDGSQLCLVFQHDQISGKMTQPFL